MASSLASSTPYFYSSISIKSILSKNISKQQYIDTICSITISAGFIIKVRKKNWNISTKQSSFEQKTSSNQETTKQKYLIFDKKKLVKEEKKVIFIFSKIRDIQNEKNILGKNKYFEIQIESQLLKFSQQNHLAMYTFPMRRYYVPFKAQSEINDAKFGAIIDSFRVTDPEMVCPSGNKITRICSNPQCKVALNCGQLKCSSCGGKVHKFCQSFPLGALTELLNDRVDQSKQFIEKIRQFDNRVIEKINNSQKELASQFCIGPFPPEIKKIVDQIYKNRRVNAVTGGEGKYLFQGIEEINSTSGHRILRLLKKYEKAIDSIIAEVIALKRQLCSGEQLQRKIKSAILKEDDPISKEHLEFIYKELNHPQELRLLYRGSENNFKAEAFHQKCGDKANTLTIIRTEFGKTIAAFTPYVWHSVPENQCVNNINGGCFILALENRQKFIPHQTNQLIRNYPNWGPQFGGGCDLFISDCCNSNKSSGFGHFLTYNTADIKYQHNKIAWKTISGSTDSHYFKVLEYQVFEVVK